MTPRRLLAESTSEDITEWMAFFQIEHEEEEKRKGDLDARARRLAGE